MKTIIIFLVILTGCASYKPMALNNLTPNAPLVKKAEVRVAAKAFNKVDCKKYLDRDVLSKGYQPVQIYIENNSNSHYRFSLNRISIPCAPFEEVANKVHTSTIGRTAGYSAAALFTCGLFAIPAIVDGVKSKQANKALDKDFSCKAAHDQIIESHSHTNMILFVPIDGYRDNFDITLVDIVTNQTKTFQIKANG